MQINRREILQTASSVALVAAAQVHARLLHGSPSGFNGGKSQIQSFNTVSGGDYPFINLLKLSPGGWVYGSGPQVGQQVDPTSLDANGYPTSLANGVSAPISYPPSRANTYVCTWTGDGSGGPAGTITAGVSSSTITSISNANPAVITMAGSPVSLPSTVIFSTTGTLPAPLVVGIKYFVMATGSNTFNVSLTNGGALINTTSAGSGSHAINGRQAVTLTLTNPNLFILTSNSANPMQNVAFFHADDEAAYNAGQIFGIQFMSILRSLKPGVIRFLDWQTAIITNCSTWSTRKPVGYCFYAGNEFRGSIFGNTTNGGTNPLDFSSTIGTGAPTDRQTIHLRFNAAPTTNYQNITATGSSPTLVAGSAHGLVAGDTVSVQSNIGLPTGFSPIANYFVLTTGLTPTNFQLSLTAGGTAIKPSDAGTGQVQIIRQMTLNLNGTGPVVIRSQNGYPCDTNDNLTPLATEIGTLVYEAQFGCWMKYGGDANFRNTGLSNGIPLEICVELCRQIGAHPYFNVPVLACDTGSGVNTGTDWVPQLATYIKNSGPSWMIPRFEGPNECWNFFGGGATDTLYAWNKSFLNWGASFYQDDHQWYGKAMSIIGQNVASVYGVAQANVHTQTKYKILCGVQSATYIGTSASDPRMTAAQYVSANGGSAAYNWATHVAVTCYVNQSEYFTLQEIADGFRYVIGNPTQQAALAAAYAATNNVNRSLNTSYGAWFTWANKFGPTMGLTCYEGGWSPDYNPANYSAFGIVTGATKANPCVLTIATSVYPNANPVSGNAAVVGMPLVLGVHGAIIGMTQLSNSWNSNVTLANGTPGLVGWTAHGFSANQAVTFSASLWLDGPFLLPTGLAAGAVYYVSAPSTNSFSVSATPGGAAIAFSGSQSGTFSCSSCWVVSAVSGNSVSINVDSTGFGTWTAGAGQRAWYGDVGGGVATYSNWMRQASKYAPLVQLYTTQNYNNVLAAGGEFPSQYTLAGATDWGVYDPDIYTATPSPAALAIAAFNN